MVSIAFFGYGYWGPNVLRNLHQHPEVKVLKAHDPAPRNADRLRRSYPTVNVVGTAAEALDDPSVEAVCIATPAETHFALAKAALERGKHVFVEKPIALTPAEAQQLHDLAQSQRKVLMVGHVYEYNVPLNTVKQYLDDGYLGNVNYVFANRTSLGPRVRTDVNVVWDYAIHDIYLSMFLLGGKPRAVRATGYCCLQKDIEDAVFIDLLFPNNVLYHVHCSWYEPIKARDMTIIGSRRMIVYDDMQMDDRVTVYNRGFAPHTGTDRYGNRGLQLFDEGITIPRLDWREPLAVEMDHFIRSIQDGTKPRSDGLDGKRTLEVIYAINQSLRNGGAEVAVP